MTTYLQEFLDDGSGKVSGVRTIQVEWTKDENGRWKMNEVEGSEKVSVWHGDKVDSSV